MNRFVRVLLMASSCGFASIPNTSDAAIVYVPDGGLMLGNTEGEAVSFAFSEVSEIFILHAWVEARTGEFWWSWGSETSRVQGVDGSDSSAARLEAGMEIGNDFIWADRGVTRLANTSGDGNFFDASGFIGVRIFEEIGGWSIENALPYYGWIRVEHNASAETLTVHDWAWNSIAGEPIQAGAIPEPRVYALVFGLGALGFVLVRRWRKRRVL